MLRNLRLEAFNLHFWDLAYRARVDLARGYLVLGQDGFGLGLELAARVEGARERLALRSFRWAVGSRLLLGLDGLASGPTRKNCLRRDGHEGELLWRVVVAGVLVVLEGCPTNGLPDEGLRFSTALGRSVFPVLIGRISTKYADVPDQLLLEGLQDLITSESFIFILPDAQIKVYCDVVIDVLARRTLQLSLSLCMGLGLLAEERVLRRDIGWLQHVMEPSWLLVRPIKDVVPSELILSVQLLDVGIVCVVSRHASVLRAPRHLRRWFSVARQLLVGAGALDGE